MTRNTNIQCEVPPAPTDKKRIVFSFGESDVEFFKCFPSDEYLGTRYDNNPVQLMIVWDPLILPYHCELQILSPSKQLLVSVPVSKQRNVPYTILDGVINGYVTKEEYVYFQFIFTKGTDFVKSTIPVKMLLSKANKPSFSKPLKPYEVDKLKSIFDNAVCKADLRFDSTNGWVYDFYSYDGTLLFSLGWIPHDVVRCSEQLLSANEKMTARQNLKIPSTVVLPISVDDGREVTKVLTEYVNKVEDATFDVWKWNESEQSWIAIAPLRKSYNDTSISFTLNEPIDGKVRVSFKSTRFVPDGDSVFLTSAYSDNLLMNENDQNYFVNQEIKE